MTISKRTRFEVFKRDKFTCQYCGRTPPTVTLQVDHIVPSSKGGEDEIENLATSCADCNLGKSNVELGAVPPPLMEQAQIRQEQAEQMQAYNAFLMEQREYQQHQLELIGHHWFNKFKKKKDSWIFAGQYEQSVKRFLKQLPVAMILDAIDIAHAKFPVLNERGDDYKTFKYFCGICWSMIRERE